MTANRLPPVGARKESTRTRIRLDLVGHEDDDVELLGHMLDPVEMETELLLTLVQLSTPEVVYTEESTNAIDDEETVPAGGEVLVQLSEQIMLVLTVVRTSCGDVLDGRLSFYAESFCDLNDSLWTEGALCV